MSDPIHTGAWLLVRRAPDLTNAEIITATGVHPETLTHMRRRHSVMLTNGIDRTGDWWRDGAFLPTATEGEPDVAPQG
ncbi:MAG: hypothetical protein ACK4S8_14365 [Alishewanella aestuarii]